MIGRTLIALLLVAPAASQPGGEGRSAATGPSSRRDAAGNHQGRILKFKHMRVDLDRREIVLDAKVCLREGTLELLICKAGSKEHESILHTDAAAAHLHAALLALGLAPGKPAEWSAGEQPRPIPPRGAALKLTLRWKDKKGKLRQADPSTWLAPADTAVKAALPKTWVFVGSDTLSNGRYWADVDGDVVSLANFESAVIDVPFESSNKNAILSFKANTTAIPSLKTPVEVIIVPLPGGKNAPHARATLYLDRTGALRLGPRTVDLSELEKWARQYMADHAKGRVLIRAVPKAIAHDIATVKRELVMGGVTDIRVEHLMSRNVLLPRTDAQVTQALRQWKNKFAAGQRLLIDPAEEATETLRQIEAEMLRVKRRQALLARYAQELSTALGRYLASTRPAGADKGSARD